MRAQRIAASGSGPLLRQTEVANDACGRRVGVAVISVHLKVNRRLFNTVLLTQLLQGLDVGHLCELRPARIADPTLLLGWAYRQSDETHSTPRDSTAARTRFEKPRATVRSGANVKMIDLLSSAASENTAIQNRSRSRTNGSDPKGKIGANKSTTT
jgi:hypothetical protein